MTTGIVIVGDIGLKYATGRRLAEDNYMIQPLSTNGANEPFHWRTTSWCRRARISTRRDARVRSVEVKPASSDISTAHMLADVNGAESQGQHFQPVWSFQQAHAR